jgi:SSS family solute:Na+ symporter
MAGMTATPRLAVGSMLLPVYFAMTVLVGWFARHRQSANQYLNASRSISLWIASAAYLAANCGALEIVGLSAMAAQYGVQAFHFYWIGAIPGMIFLALWMMPVYRRSGVRSVPEYLELRYGPSLRLLNAIVLGTTMLLLGGISLYAMGQTLEVLAGIGFIPSIAISAGVVLLYVLFGGIKATIYNEVLQLVVIVAGIAPLAWVARSGIAAASQATGPQGHLWTALPLDASAAPLDAVGVVLGLGFVLSFGYWCTDFVQMQRAFTARTESEGRQVPLWAGFGKLAFSLIVVLPGLAAGRLIPGLGHGKPFDQALPQLMNLYYGPAMLGLGLTALAASLMSGLAANLSAVAAVWTEDIYRSRLRPNETDRHYLAMGRATTVLAAIVCCFTSFIDFLFNNLMEQVQLIFSIFGAPFWAIFLMGMLSRRMTERAALVAFTGGASFALAHTIAYAEGWIHYGSVMNANFHAAIYAFAFAVALGMLVSVLWPERGPEQRAARASSLVFEWTPGGQLASPLLWTLSALLLGCCAALNWVWR